MAARMRSGMGRQPACLSCAENIPVVDLRVLPCLHTFCKDCLSKPSEGENGYRCMTCSKTFTMGEYGVNGLPTINQEMSEILSMVGSGYAPGSDETEPPKPVLCHACDEGASASSVCMHCNDYLCDRCALYHGHTSLAKDHFMMPLNQQCLSGPCSSQSSALMGSAMSGRRLDHVTGVASLSSSPAASSSPGLQLSHHLRSMSLGSAAGLRGDRKGSLGTSPVGLVSKERINGGWEPGSVGDLGDGISLVGIRSSGSGMRGGEDTGGMLMSGGAEGGGGVDLYGLGALRTSGSDGGGDGMLSERVENLTSVSMGCAIHPEKSRSYYCHTCAMYACLHCMKQAHATHNYVYIRSATNNSLLLLESASRMNDTHQVLCDARECVRVLESGVVHAQETRERVDGTCGRIADDISMVGRRAHQRIEESEREMAHQLEIIRQVKAQHLTISTKSIQGSLQKLSSAIGECEYLLRGTGLGISSVPSPLLTESLHNLREEMASVKKVSAYAQLSTDDDIVQYIPPDPMFLQHVRPLGLLTSSVFPPKCVAVGETLQRAVRGSQTRFTVIAHDHSGAQRTSGGDGVDVCVVAPVTCGGGERSGGVPGTRSPRLPVDVVDQKTGVYTAIFTPLVDGYHEVAVTVRGVHIKGSPFRCLVKAGREYTNVSTPRFSFGSEGDADGSVCRPWGVCCDRDGNVLVADRSNNRVQVFTRVGEFMFKYGSSGSAPGQFDRPAGIVVSPQSNHTVVADKDNHRVQVFTRHGQYVRQFGEKGSKNGQFNYPWDVGVRSDGCILVSDTRNHRVQLFSSEGAFISKYGFEGGMWKHFDSPRGVTFSRDNHAIVTDFNNHRVLIITPDMQSAQFLGCEGSANGQFLRPQGVTVDEEGYILVSDSRNNRIQVFHPSGKFYHKIEGAAGSQAQMDRPSGICLAPDGSILVVDFGNNRIVVY